MAFEPNLSVVGQIGKGTLAMMPKPVTGEFGDDEFMQIAALGYRRVVSLLEHHENEDYELADESSLCVRYGMEFVSYPIRDRSLPESVKSFSEFTGRLYRSISNGESTVVHCLAGIGRSGIVAGAILIHSGMEAVEAFAQLSEARGFSVPDTDEQRKWIVSNQLLFRQ